MESRDWHPRQECQKITSWYSGDLLNFLDENSLCEKKVDWMWRGSLTRKKWRCEPRKRDRDIKGYMVVSKRVKARGLDNMPMVVKLETFWEF